MDSTNAAGPVSLKASSVLLVGGRPAERSRLRAALGKHVALVDSAENALKAKRLMTRCEFEFLVVDGGLEDIPALDWIDSLRREGAAQAIVLALEAADSATVLEAMRRGAADVLEWPIVTEALLAALQRHAVGPAARAPTRLPDPGAAEARERELVGDSALMRQVRDLVRRIAPLPGTVLIEGETGTGKELVARWLHACSTRRGDFVAVNCGAIAPELLESELFGHTKGAFTSAHQGREGLFVAARGGTLYLDEVSEMPFPLQVKLLRVLEEGTIRAVGSDREIPVDARIVASTQHDLLALVRERRFREDLYFRLNVAQVNLPPLRDRLDDIATLARHFMGVLSARLGVEPLALDTRAIARLQDHAWRGNVRELKNFVERSLMLGALATEQLAPAEQEAPRPVAEYPLDWTLEEVKEHHMARVLNALGGNKSAAARRLGISRKTLERRMQLGPGNTESA
ncbi:sigma-54 dependent transcriptional regulator [Wenzhouxiangella sp. XN24]|uniref:sigma-54-dependent transcriptional regulator n=1 Tax=Wenzhouxiangella sp. XN24 TaxID=2713569 RepID=UPI0013ED6D1C|nr:sigma-54 dependent transcriptional regulator [Wenzhouxiangella sp. XN24]NGX14941.1 sigma-54-dependent Fis family transcriptional regulator [Wenzhouxiangella sp. XN24]